MSIRKKPEKAIPVLLARLHKAKEYALQGAKTEDADDANETHPLAMKFKDIESELKDMEHWFPKIKSWEKRVTEQFCALEQELDNDIFKDPEMESQVHDTLDLIKGDIVNLRSLISGVDMGISGRLLTMSFKPNYLPTKDDHLTASPEWVDPGIEGNIFESEAMSCLSASFHCLESSHVKMCLLCLSIFPENSVIKKKPLIYWWMGEGLVTKNKNQTAEEVGEHVFQELLNEGFIRPSSENKSPSVNSFIVYPWIRRMLILMAKKNRFLTFSPRWTPCNGNRRAFLWQGNASYSMSNGEKEEDLLTVFNVTEQYLGTRPEWLSKLKKVEVLQMGRWHNSVTHHIEVENDQMLLNGLGSQTHLKYLSLRGISRIESLPPSISKLISLQILDLRACHNLEKLPPGISKLRNLTHLDMSECYLLESVPKGLEKIHALQVLKGFVVSKAGKNTCKITDLAQLVNLRKLSIRVGNQGEGQQDDQLDSLINLHALRILKISWGVILSVPGPVSLPQGLLKLDLQCAPLVSVPQWLLPTRLPNLEKLYINGGELNSLDHQDTQNWKVKFLRLKYLKNLKIDQEKLVSLFPEYQYLEKISCHKLDRDISLNRAG